MAQHMKDAIGSVMPKSLASADAAGGPSYNDCSVMARTQYNLMLMDVQRQERQAAQAAAAAEGTAAAEKFLSECEEPGVKKARRDWAEPSNQVGWKAGVTACVMCILPENMYLSKYTTST